jgi:hypothetical protein
MSDSRLPKQVLFGELLEGKRPLGRPKRRYAENVKETLTGFSIEPRDLLRRTNDRNEWRRTVTSGAQKFEAGRTERMEERRRRRHENRPLNPQQTFLCRYCPRESVCEG